MAETGFSLIVPNAKKKKTAQFSSSSSSASPLAIFSRKSLFYDRLPSQPLRLSVLKLDGSSFDIQVSKNATIAELKDSVEAVFSYVPQNGPGKISWPHVWGQFCLCYDEKKLVKEEDYLRDYGVKDGDQLRFIRHTSNDCGVQRKRSKKRVFHLKQHRRSQVNYCKRKDNSDNDDDGDSIGSDENAEVKDDTKEVHVAKNKITGFVGDLLYTPLAIVRKTPLAIVRKTETQNQIFPSAISRCLLGSFRKIRRIVCFGKRKQYSIWKRY